MASLVAFWQQLDPQVQLLAEGVAAIAVTVGLLAWRSVAR